MICEVVELCSSRNVKVTCLCYDKSPDFKNIIKRPFMIVLPGGGYQFCSRREMEPIAFRYLDAGYNVFILEYSLKENAKWPNPVLDYDLLLDFLTNNQEKYQLDISKFGVIGFSAGGHLAIATGIYGKVKPTCLVLGYPVTDVKLARILDNSLPDMLLDLTPTFPRTFIFHSATDDIVPISNAISLMNCLEKNGIIFEAHIYPFGPHGFSTGQRHLLALGINTSSRVKNWLDDSIDFLEEAFGKFNEGFMETPQMPLCINSDSKRYYSLDSTIKFLMNNPSSLAILEKYMFKEIKKDVVGFSKNFGVAAIEFAKNGGFERFIAFLENRTLTSFKSYYKDLPYEIIENELLKLNNTRGDK